MWCNWHLVRTLNEHKIYKEGAEVEEILGRESRINTDADTRYFIEYLKNS